MVVVVRGGSVLEGILMINCDDNGVNCMAYVYDVYSLKVSGA